MFASSQFPLPASPARFEPRLAPVEAGEGHDSEACRRATAALLLPGGHPGGWLLLLAGSCVYVLVQAIALRFA